MRTAFVFVGLALVLSSCATEFYGSPHFPGGARGCYERCEDRGMQMDSFVYLGEYSSGCVCRLRRAPRGATGGSTGSGAGAVGVVMQMRAAEERRSESASHTASEAGGPATGSVAP